jgi:hypothetical protein
MVQHETPSLALLPLHDLMLSQKQVVSLPLLPILTWSHLCCYIWMIPSNGQLTYCRTTEAEAPHGGIIRVYHTAWGTLAVALQHAQASIFTSDLFLSIKRGWQPFLLRENTLQDILVCKISTSIFLLGRLTYSG